MLLINNMWIEKNNEYKKNNKEYLNLQLEIHPNKNIYRV